MEGRDLIEVDFVLPYSLPAADAADDEDGGEGEGRGLSVRCWVVSSAALLSLTRRSHPSYARRCWTGLAVYGGAEVLALLFLRRPQLLRGRAALELGCGIGLAAIAAVQAMQGEEEGGGEERGKASTAGCVVATDGEEDAVALARLNLARHIAGKEAEGRRRSDGGQDPIASPLSSPALHCAHLRPPSLSSPGLPSVSCVRAVWSEVGAAELAGFLASSSLPRSFALLYGSDLLYSRTSIPALLKFAQAFLSSSSSSSDRGGGCGCAAAQLLLCHSPRVADLPRLLRCEAAALGLCVLYLPLRSFLAAAEVRERGWAAIDLAVLCRVEDCDAVHEQHTDDRGQRLLQEESQAEQVDRAEREQREAQEGGAGYEGCMAGLHQLQLDEVDW